MKLDKKYIKLIDRTISDLRNFRDGVGTETDFDCDILADLNIKLNDLHSTLHTEWRKANRGL